MGRKLVQTPARSCETCGKPFYRRQSPCGVWESAPCFSRRRFCSLSCANSRSKGGPSRKAFHARARKSRGRRCECCGTDRRLHVHHVNEDWRDNSPGNLQTLCIFCHQFWHATHRRLGIVPTQRMPPLFSRSSSAPPPEWDACAPTVMRLSGRSRRNLSKRT
jgi:hypothetical protein